VVLWLAAMLLFYLPLAAVVTWLNQIMPLEGGLYQWAKLGFNDVAGFLVAWNLWLFAILSTSEIGLQVSQYLRYILGAESEWLTGSRWFTAAVTLTIISGLVALTTVGLGAGKWVHKLGGALLVLTFAAIVALPLLNHAHGTAPPFHPLATAMPAMSLTTINLFGKLGFGALGGFEYVAIHAGECRDPARTIKRSVIIAAPIIALMFILGSSAVLALVPRDAIDLIAPIPQVLNVGFGKLGVAVAIVPLTIMGFIVIRIAQSSVSFGANTRLPMVAGWDNLLPQWFTRLHARYRTPVNSILFVGAVTLALAVVGMIGVGKQEAFQLLWNASGVFYALTYVVMFAIPLWGLRGSGERAPWALKVCAVSGLLMTLLYLAVSVVPLVQVESRLGFALKLSGLIVLTNAIGATLVIGYRRRNRPVRSRP
jgi:glutamate:GABA antiporter